MSPIHAKVHKRVNLTLPDDTLRLIRRIAPKGDRSRLVNEAVHFYVQGVGRARLRNQLREGVVRRAGRDLKLAEEWFALENEVWGKRSGK